MERFTQLPSKEHNDLTPIEKLVYVYIRRHMDKITNSGPVSQHGIAVESGLDRRIIARAIQRLIDADYLEILYKEYKKVTIYKVKRLIHFEPFSDEFLDNKNIKPLEKAYIVSAQEHMFKDNIGEGCIKYSDQQLGNLINMPRRTVSKCNQSLVSQGYLSLNTDNNGDVVKTFKLNKLGQIVIWTLCDHEDRITKMEKEFAALKEENKRLKKQLDKQKEEPLYL